MTDEKKSRIIQVSYPRPVRRVTINWDGEKWAVIGQFHVESMTLQAPAELPEGDESTGFWIEVSNEKGEILHRQVITNPFLGMEQFGKDGSIFRLDHPPHDLTIEVLLPHVDGATKLHLVDRVPEPRGSEKKSKRPERTVLSLDKDADGGGGKDNPGGGHHH